MLSFGMKPSFSLEIFLEDCRRLLTEEDYVRLETVLSPGPRAFKMTRDVLGRWVDFEQRFRNELAWVRATRAHQDPQKYVRGERAAESFIHEAIAQAQKAADPWEAERVLDACRWRYLDELEQGRFFHFDNVLIFGLRLQILERHQIFKSPQGQEIFDEYKKFEITDKRFFY